MSDLVLFQQQDGLGWITIDRPEVMNALSYDTLARLGEIVDSIAADDSVRVVLVTGSGDKAFCAGADLKERRDFTEEQTVAFVHRIGETFRRLATLPQPSIAVMNGVAYGGGLELALACDLRVAVKGSKMGLTETSLAIIPGAGGTQRLPAVVGVARAKELILAASRLDADQAERIGLVNAVAEPGELRACAETLARSIAANGPLAVRAAKLAIDQMGAGGDDAGLDARLERERALYLEHVLPSRDRLEALAAFREKRKPEYEGR